MTHPKKPLGLVLLLVAAVAACTEDGPDDGPDNKEGETDFTTTERGPGNGVSLGAAPGASATGSGGSSGAGAGGASGASVTDKAPGAPGGRVAEVTEADIYKMSGTNLFYLNTYRGFIIYDVADAKAPKKVSRLPVYGYPVEMFVKGSTVYALLQDALYLTEKEGKLQFERHNVSQLVTIDVSDVANPRVLKTIDIIGRLREGVSRKIDDTIYVVSQQWGGYYWGWPGIDQLNQKEQAWVYSFDVADPLNPRNVDKLQIFEGGGVQNSDPQSGTYYQRYFSGVAISATSNALMVVENWQTYSSNRSGSSCGSENSQQAVVSIIDVSDPKGTIRRHSRFETTGALDDQFKMTYVFDDVAKTGTFYGIFAQQTWSNCFSTSRTLNTLESWDVTNGAQPARLATLNFGKENETVRASAYDVERKVVYAITARQIDPLYAISIADRTAPKVLSAIDGLSGSVSVFRTVGGGQFLLGVGQDQSTACTGFQDDPTTGWRSTKMAVSLIDVRALDRIRLVQRKCVAVQNAEWTSSAITWNQDQAHKMLGMFQDGTLNVITVPVAYAKRTDLTDGWWYRWETAVGLMTWDLTKYDDTKPETAQTVIENFGTFVHPEGEVARSILFRHPTTNARTMINLSDTHLSLANIDDLARPRLESIVEVAPRVAEIYRFGQHLVERVEIGTGSWQAGVSEFRVKAAGGPVDEKTPVATFRVGQVGSIYQYKQNLVVMRSIYDPNSATPPRTEAVIYDLSNPAQPRRASRIDVPVNTYRYYGFSCGVGWGGGYWFGNNGKTAIITDLGLVQAETTSTWTRDGVNLIGASRVVLLDLRDIDHPAVSETKLESSIDRGYYSLVEDPAAPAGFYLSYRNRVGEQRMANGEVFTRFRYYAQRWDLGKDGWQRGAEVNIPGPLAKTWVNAAGERLFLTHDSAWRTVVVDQTRTEWHADSRVNLLRVEGALARLRSARLFTDLSLTAMVVNGERLLVSAQAMNFWANIGTASWETTSDRLMIFDLSAAKLTTVYDQPTRTYGVQLMGTHEGKLFVNLPGDGVLVTDVSNPTQPQGIKFLRTLGYATHIQFVDNDAYVASGNFGVFHMSLNAAKAIPLD